MNVPGKMYSFKKDECLCRGKLDTGKRTLKIGKNMNKQNVIERIVPKKKFRKWKII